MTTRPTLAGIARAEVVKLASRVSVRLALVLLVGLSLGVPLLAFVGSRMIVTSLPPGMEGAEVPTAFAMDAGTAFSFVMGLRNFFLFRALIIVVVSMSFAGEFVGRTLREDLVRPVSRATVLGGKWLALQAFVALGVAVPVVLAVPLSLLLFGFGGDLVLPLQRAALVGLGDAGFATLVMAISVAVRSVPGTIGGVFLYWVLDRTLGFGFWAVEVGKPFLLQVLEGARMQDFGFAIDAVIAVRPWLPSAAFEVYWDWDPARDVPWRSLVALGLYTALSYGVGLLVFRRVDVD